MEEPFRKPVDVKMSGCLISMEVWKELAVKPPSFWANPGPRTGWFFWLLSSMVLLTE
jgi:hypothetical protein